MEDERRNAGGQRVDAQDKMGKEELDDDRDVAQQLDIERGQAPRQEAAARPKAADEGSQEAGAGDGDERELEREHQALRQIAAVFRSEERRVGKECVSTGRSRGSRYH